MRRVLRVLGLAAALVLLASGVAWAASAARDWKLVERLCSGDPEVRRRAALRTEAWTPQALTCVAARLAEVERAPESGADPELRKTYVDTLGRGQNASLALPVLAAVLRKDPSPYVRWSAWRAAGRQDATAAQRIADEHSAVDDPWDQLGRAELRLALGDVRGAPALLHWAAHGEADVRLIACRALHDSVGPVLEAVGRWPLTAERPAAAPWPAELVAEVSKRCAGLDLQSLADGLRQQLARSAPVRRDLARITGARERIARLILR